MVAVRCPLGDNDLSNANQDGPRPCPQPRRAEPAHHVRSRPMMAFACPHCHASLSAPDERAGHTARCPTCKGSVAIPFPAAVPVPAGGHADAPPAAIPVPAPRPRPAMSPVPPSWPRPHSAWSYVRLTAWLVCGTAALGILGNYLATLGHTETVFQQCFAAADACSWLIGAYVLARCTDAVTRHFEGPEADLGQPR